MTYEVEIKVAVGEDDERRIRAHLCEKEGHTIEETDIYYTSKHRDLIKSEECVRIRISDSVRELTWKPPTNDDMRMAGQFWKTELNVPIGGALEEWRRMMERLDFVEYATVRKLRTYFSYDDSTSVMIDRVDGVGTFIEIETNSQDSPNAVAKNAAVVEMLGLSSKTIVNVPYRDLVVQRT